MSQTHIPKTIVLIHGAWVTGPSWDTFRKPFEDAGYKVLVPTWPSHLDAAGEPLSAEAINKNLPKTLGPLTVGAIVDHLYKYIDALPEKPIIIGHSFGGLFTQLLLDRSAGAVGVAINPAPIGGIAPDFTALTGIAPAVFRLNGWNRPYTMTRHIWTTRFAGTSPVALAHAAYDSYVIPTSGRILHQAATWLGTRIKPARRTQPLLITGSDKDRLISPNLSKAAFNIQRRSPARTDYIQYEGLSHFLIAEPGYERVAQSILDWLSTL
jgi:pimeloyl-ACP methyl ester carboxylesterase